MFISSLVTLVVVFTKANWDNKNWGKVNHTLGIGLVALILIPLCILICNPFPIFLYGLTFNPTINTIRKIPGFYIGSTSKVDIFLRKNFSKYPGQIFALINLILLLLTITWR